MQPVFRKPDDLDMFSGDLKCKIYPLLRSISKCLVHVRHWQNTFWRQVPKWSLDAFQGLGTLPPHPPPPKKKRRKKKGLKKQVLSFNFTLVRFCWQHLKIQHAYIRKYASQSGTSWTQTSGWWASQMCSDKFKDFCQTRCPWSLKLGMKWDLGGSLLPITLLWPANSAFCVWLNKFPLDQLRAGPQVFWSHLTSHTCW